MPRSMTGFGAGRSTVGAEEISVELRSVNHKFCEVKARLPRELMPFEASLVKAVKDRLARGAVDLVVRRGWVAQSSAIPLVDVALAREYQRAFAELGRALGTSDAASMALIAQQPGVLRLEDRPAVPEDAQRALEAALAQALDVLVAMREREGASIAA